ncbi:unnamed protein product [Litomosoides sigmodontis]|uniref:Tudor domain-containing protein n=1 Tax=Litomosoides sigmodontis TaxID=42156 RepID=A0A3P6T971_LITSI|nr:unnamed protein product [Litomosoides sigmodontis]
MAVFGTVDISRSTSTSGRDFSFDFNSKLMVDKKEQVKWSECRDLVEVPGEPEWELRCMAEAFPQYCWKYAEPQVIAHYHYSIATSASAPARQSSATLPVFYAHLPHSFSPYDFSIQPKSLDRARERLYRQIQAVYNLVDIGNDNIAQIENIRPLLKVFGRLPPLALRCRMKGVDMNDLTIEKVNAFQSLIKSCGDVVRVELADVCSIPFLVNLYHPTVQGTNLGKLFYPEHKATREKRCNKKLVQMNDDFSNDFMGDESSEDEYVQPTHVLHLERLQKPTTDEPLYISHIENSRFIYLHCEYHKKAIEKLEKQLLTKWFELKIIPEKWLMPALACAYSDSSICNPCRVIIAEIGDETVLLRSADHGWKKNLLKTNCLSGSLRLLTREFSETPLTQRQVVLSHTKCVGGSDPSSVLGALMSVCSSGVYAIIGGKVGCAKWRSGRITFGVKHLPVLDIILWIRNISLLDPTGLATYLCCLPTSMQYHPHRSETDILRSILPTGTIVHIRRFPCKRCLPYKVDIFLENDESVTDILEQLRIKKRIIHPCFDLVPYKQSVFTDLYEVDCNYREDLELFQPFAKGHLEYASL